MKKYINVGTVISSVAVIAGLFAYRQFGERHVNKALNGEVA